MNIIKFAKDNISIEFLIKIAIIIYSKFYFKIIQEEFILALVEIFTIFVFIRLSIFIVTNLDNKSQLYSFISKIIDIIVNYSLLIVMIKFMGDSIYLLFINHINDAILISKFMNKLFLINLLELFNILFLMRLRIFVFKFINLNNKIEAYSLISRIIDILAYYSLLRIFFKFEGDDIYLFFITHTNDAILILIALTMFFIFNYLNFKK